MNKARFTIRFLLLLSYFLPFHFISCDSTSFQFAYNREEAKELATQQARTAEDTTTTYNHILVDPIAVPGNTAYEDSMDLDTTLSARQTTVKGTDDPPELLQALFFPVEEAASGLGAALCHKNTEGMIAAGAGLVVALLLVVSTPWLNKRHWLVISLFLASLLFLLSFIIISYTSEVELLWGVWTALTMAVTGLVLEIIDRRRTAGH